MLTVTEGNIGPTLSLCNLLPDLESVTKGCLWQVKRKDPQGVLLMTITGVFFFETPLQLFLFFPLPSPLLLESWLARTNI